MKTPKKSRKIYETLRRDILKRRYALGEQLPHETDFAKSFGVSRDTLRAALAMLEKESLIRRIRGAGTFVSKHLERKKITFLLPHPASVDSYSRALNGILQGVLEESQTKGCDVETLAVSPTNNPDDIDWNAFFNINSESLVVVAGFWFAKVFPYLLASKCRASFIYDSMSPRPEILGKIKSWNTLEKCSYENAREMTGRLLSMPCTRPGIFLRFLKQGGFLYRAISDYCREHFPEVPLHFEEVPHKPEETTLFCRRLESVLEKENFDGFIINDYQVYRTVRRRFPDLPCAYIDLMIQTDRAGDENVIHSWFDLREIGRDAVKCLLEKNAEPVKKKYFATISRYDSGSEFFSGEPQPVPAMEPAC